MNKFRGYLNIFFLVVILYLIVSFAHAATPNPGHPWIEVGDGTFQVVGPTALRTFTFPDVNATVLTSNSAVTVAQGGTGAATLTGILKGNGTSAVTAVAAPSGAIVGDTDTQILTGKTINKASNTLTGVAGSGANSDITSLSALSTALSVAQGGTGATTLTSNNVLLGNGTGALQVVAPSTSGNVLSSNGTTWVSGAPEDQVLYSQIGINPVSLTAVTALTTGLTHFTYMGAAAKNYTSCSILVNVTTAGATITWAEVAIFKGIPPMNTTASLTRLGSTNVSATFNSIGRKVTAVTVSVAAGDTMWIAYGSSATTPFQLRGLLSDDLQSGVFQTGSVQPSAAGTPFTTTLATATAVPAWARMKCT